MRTHLMMKQLAWAVLLAWAMLGLGWWLRGRWDVYRARQRRESGGLRELNP